MARLFFVMTVLALLCGCDEKQPAQSNRNGVGPAGNPGTPPSNAVSGVPGGQLPAMLIPSPRSHQTIQEIIFVEIPGGNFVMGAPPFEPGFHPNQKQRFVVIPQPYWMSQTEVTQTQFQRVMGRNPSATKGGNLPVTNVTWDEAREFAQRLTGLDPTFSFRLPTEEEWEYACRAGSDLPFAPPHGRGTELQEAIQKHTNGDPEFLTRYVHRFASIQQNAPQPVSALLPNAWGLYDMHGNVWEWCADDGADPNLRPIRGGGWGTTDVFGCRAAVRDWAPCETCKDSFGFRIVAERRQ